MLNYKMIASDLDGTLLKNDKLISRENLDAIEKFLQIGGIFVPTTGRAVAEIPAFLLDNPYIRYIICSDGAGIYDKQTNECELNFIPHRLLMHIIDIISSFETHIVVHHNNIAYSDISQEQFDREQYEFFGKIKPRYMHFANCVLKQNFRAFCDTLDGAELVFILFRNKHELEKCLRIMREINEFNILSSAESSLEIVSKTSDKGFAFLRLAKQLNIPVEQTICVGDNINDINMITSAGLGLAVSNAVEDLKQAADDVICTNEEHVIDYILHHYIK